MCNDNNNFNDLPNGSKGQDISVEYPQEQFEEAQPIDTLNSELMELLHTELDAHPKAASLPEFDTQLRKHLQVQFTKNTNEHESEKESSDEKALWQDIFERKQKFYAGSKWELPDDEQFHTALEKLYMSLEEISTLNKSVGLKLLYSKTFDFVVALSPAYAVFGKGTSLYKSVFDACMFSGLCMFLCFTKRLKGIPLSQYVYAYSHFGFSNKESTNYIRHEGTWKRGERTESLDSSERTLRQWRHRLFKSRPVDSRRPEWSAMPESSVHEWQLYFDFTDADGTADPRLRGTLKRIGNLYKGLNKAVNSPKDDEYGKRLDNAWKKFQSKLHKIKYENYLALCQAFLAHIKKEQEEAGGNWEEKTYYGINLNRFEMELRLFELTNDVNRLLKCKSDKEKGRILFKSISLSNIWFPQVRNEFCRNSPVEDIYFFRKNFVLSSIALFK